MDREPLIDFETVVAILVVVLGFAFAVAILKTFL